MSGLLSMVSGQAGSRRHEPGRLPLFRDNASLLHPEKAGVSRPDRGAPSHFL